MRKRNILFVDDDSSILISATLFLRYLEHEIIHADSGPKAIELLNTVPDIDVMFLDLMMPEMDGFEVLRRVRKTHASLPIIVQTGVIDDRDLKKAKRLGANDLIIKPYTKEEVARLINKHTKKV